MRIEQVLKNDPDENSVYCRARFRWNNDESHKNNQFVVKTYE